MKNKRIYNKPSKRILRVARYAKKQTQMFLAR